MSRPLVGNAVLEGLRASLYLVYLKLLVALAALGVALYLLYILTTYLINWLQRCISAESGAKSEYWLPRAARATPRTAATTPIHAPRQPRAHSVSLGSESDLEAPLISPSGSSNDASCISSVHHPTDIPKNQTKASESIGALTSRDITSSGHGPGGDENSSHHMESSNNASRSSFAFEPSGKDGRVASSEQQRTALEPETNVSDNKVYMQSPFFQASTQEYATDGQQVVASVLTLVIDQSTDLDPSLTTSSPHGGPPRSPVIRMTPKQRQQRAVADAKNVSPASHDNADNLMRAADETPSAQDTDHSVATESNHCAHALSQQLFGSQISDPDHAGMHGGDGHVHSDDLMNIIRGIRDSTVSQISSGSGQHGNSSVCQDSVGFVVSAQPDDVSLQWHSNGAGVLKPVPEATPATVGTRASVETQHQDRHFLSMTVEGHDLLQLPVFDVVETRATETDSAVSSPFHPQPSLKGYIQEDEFPEHSMPSLAMYAGLQHVQDDAPHDDAARAEKEGSLSEYPTGSLFSALLAEVTTIKPSSSDNNPVDIARHVSGNARVEIPQEVALRIDTAQDRGYVTKTPAAEPAAAGPALTALKTGRRSSTASDVTDEESPSYALPGKMSLGVTQGRQQQQQDVPLKLSMLRMGVEQCDVSSPMAGFLASSSHRSDSNNMDQVTIHQAESMTNKESPGETKGEEMHGRRIIRDVQLEYADTALFASNRRNNRSISAAGTLQPSQSTQLQLHLPGSSKPGGSVGGREPVRRSTSITVGDKIQYLASRAVDLPAISPGLPPSPSFAGKRITGSPDGETQELKIPPALVGFSPVHLKDVTTPMTVSYINRRDSSDYYSSPDVTSNKAFTTPHMLRPPRLGPSMNSGNTSISGGAAAPGVANPVSPRRNLDEVAFRVTGFAPSRAISQALDEDITAQHEHSTGVASASCTYLADMVPADDISSGSSIVGGNAEGSPSPLPSRAPSMPPASPRSLLSAAVGIHHRMGAVG